MAKKPLIIANWKSNKTVKEALEWWGEFKEKLRNWEIKKLGNWENIEIVICPPFLALQALKYEIRNTKYEIRLGAQDISPFDDGPYTGEVSARMLSELVDYVLVGHSERRKHFGETTEVIGQKVKMAQKAGIIPIVCAANFEEISRVKDEFWLVYEPPSAISQAGVYHPDTPENAQRTLAQWKSRLGKASPRCLYGGSVNPGNVSHFLIHSDIDGVVVGYASLDPVTFSDLLANVSS